METIRRPFLSLWQNVEGRQNIQITGEGTPAAGHVYLVGKVEVDDSRRTATVHLYRNAEG